MTKSEMTNDEGNPKEIRSPNFDVTRISTFGFRISIMLRISRQTAGETEASDFSAAFDARDERHQPRVDRLEIKEQHDAAGHRGVAMKEPELRQAESARLFEHRALAQGIGGHVAQRGHKVQRFIRLAL